MERLFTPWRYRYVTGQGPPAEGCFLCRAAEDPADPDRLVVHQARHHLVVLNRHPYTNGHLMVAPRKHLAVPEAQDDGAREELWSVVLLSRQVLNQIYRPDGMNLGANLGRVAGAGVPGHFHLHLVPRWEADVNFMTVTSETRIVPEDLGQSWERLRQGFGAQGGSS